MAQAAKTACLTGGILLLHSAHKDIFRISSSHRGSGYHGRFLWPLPQHCGRDSTAPVWWKRLVRGAHQYHNLPVRSKFFSPTLLPLIWSLLRAAAETSCLAAGWPRSRWEGPPPLRTPAPRRTYLPHAQISLRTHHRGGRWYRRVCQSL